MIKDSHARFTRYTPSVHQIKPSVRDLKQIIDAAKHKLTSVKETYFYSAWISKKNGKDWSFHAVSKSKNNTTFFKVENNLLSTVVEVDKI